MATGGRRKTVYRITPEGERLFFELLEEPPTEGQTEDTRFRLRLAFFRYLPPETRIRLLERRRLALRGPARHGEGAPARPRRHRRLPALRSLEHGRAAIEADIAWITELIQRERTRYGITAPVGDRRHASRDAAKEGALGMSKVRIAIVGVGNCASSLVQGLTYYRDADPSDRVPGLMHVELGGYHVRDVEVVAAFDVDANKVGKDVAEAIFTEPNNTIRFSDVRAARRDRVRRAGPSTGSGTYYRQTIEESDAAGGGRRAGAAATRGADVLISYLPVGSERGRPLLRAVRDRRQGGARERAAGVHRQRPRVGGAVRRRRRADRR